MYAKRNCTAKLMSQYDVKYRRCALMILWSDSKLTTYHGSIQTIQNQQMHLKAELHI